MEIGLRIFSLFLDFIFGILAYILTLSGVLSLLNGIGYIVVWLYDKSGWYVNGSSSVAIDLLFAILFPIVFWILYIVVPTGIWGKTIGKWICRLSVTDYRGNPPGFWRALSRETLKILAIGTAIGIAVILIQTIYQGTAWYDQMCNTQVAFTPRIRLTQTQKNWRKIVNKK